MYLFATASNVTTYGGTEWMNEWKCEDFKCVWKPTESRLCLTHYVNGNGCMIIIIIIITAAAAATTIIIITCSKPEN